MSVLQHLHSQLRGTLWVIVMTLLFTVAIACFWVAGVESALLSVEEAPAADTEDSDEARLLQKLKDSERMGLLRGDELVSLSIQQDVTHLTIVRDQQPLRIEYRTSEQQK